MRTANINERKISISNDMEAWKRSNFLYYMNQILTRDIKSQPGRIMTCTKF